MLYQQLVDLYEKLDDTSKRLEKTYFISQLLKTVPDDELNEVILLIQGKVYPAWDNQKIGIAAQSIIKAISKTTGDSTSEIENLWKKLGDLGDVAKFALNRIKQSSLFPKNLEVSKVFLNLRKLSIQEGRGSNESKLNIIQELFINAKPKEAKYLVRTLIDNLRIGIGKGSIRDAIIWAYFSDELKITYDKINNEIEIDENNRSNYNEIVQKVQYAIDLSNDFTKVALLLKNEGMKGLDKIKLDLNKPINVMLFQKAKDVNDAFKIVGKPAAFEYKYDGFRVIIHKHNDIIKIFTRSLEEVTNQFPDIVKFVLENVKSNQVIMEGEAVGYDKITKKYVPFQIISQRIRRKNDIEKIALKHPVEVNLFDIIYFEGKNLLNEPFINRRKILEGAINQVEKKIVLTKQIITDDEVKAQLFYEKSLKMGEEGIMAKNLSGIYKPGSRTGYGVKLKSIMDPLDLVIVAAEYGEGKRSGWLSSFYLAIDFDGELKEIGKVSTGLKELEEEGTSFKEMTKLLEPLIIKSMGKKVIFNPQIVIEVGYEEIQKSINYDSGYALRFPRFIRLRTDEKNVDNINNIDDVELLYKHQRERG